MQGLAILVLILPVLAFIGWIVWDTMKHLVTEMFPVILGVVWLVSAIAVAIGNRNPVVMGGFVLGLVVVALIWIDVARDSHK